MERLTERQEIKMRFQELIPLIQNEVIVVHCQLDCGTNEYFNIEIMRGQRLCNCRIEYLTWLNTLNLKVKNIGFCQKDTQGNENMLCVNCYPLKVKKR